MLAAAALGAALLGTADTGSIVFARERNDVHTLQRLDLATGELTQLVRVQGGIYDVAATPDGSKIAYLLQGRKGFSVRVRSGGDDRQVHRVPGQYIDGIDWDPSGSRIVFAAGREEQLRSFELWTMSGRGNNVRRVTRNRAFEVQPSYTEDGGRIVHVRVDREGTDLASVRTDGTRRRTLTRTAGVELEPEVGPDGRVAYVGDDAVRVLDRGGRSRRVAGTRRYGRVNPSWSADGRSLAFSLRWQIATADLRTGEVTRVLRSGTDDRYPVFVP